MAVDLKDMLNPQHLRNWILGTPKLRKGGDVEALATLLAGLKMARLSVHVDNSIVARLRLDFDAPVGQNGPRVEQAVAQWLDDAGARPRTMAAAKAQVSGNSVTFEAPLDEVGLRRVLSLIRSPHLPPKEAAAESREPNALASAAYYDKVCGLLNALFPGIATRPSMRGPRCGTCNLPARSGGWLRRRSTRRSSAGAGM